LNLKYNADNPYLTDYVINNKYAFFFAKGGLFIKNSRPIGEKYCLLHYEIPPSIHPGIIEEEILLNFEKINCQLEKRYLYNASKIQNKDSLLQALRVVFKKFTMEQPYFDWVTFPTPISVIKKHTKNINQVILGPGYLTNGQSGLNNYQNQMKLFCKIIENLRGC
ncbi:MAG: hypothetical protein ACTSYQ_04110, partial [Candidatus Odinarchaeia archaeon]